MTPKQAQFVVEYLIDLNATQAAIRAGYSKRSADKIGSQNLAKPDIAAAIETAKIARSQRTAVDSDWVLARLHAEVEADLADLFDEENRLKPVKDWPLIWRQGLVAGVEVDELFEGRGEEREQIGYVKKLKLSDRVKRLELIGKHIGVQAFQEQVKVSGLDGLADRLRRAEERDRDPSDDDDD
jgi:phage terminase small subunit